MTTRIVAIAGPSGSGKTTLAESLQQTLQARQLAAAILAEDAYYRDQAHLNLSERTAVNYDHPDAMEHELLDEHLARLRRGQAVQVPVYDYTVHTRAQQTRTLEPPAVLIVEGILLLNNPELRRHFDYSVFLDLPLDVCLQRRIRRDSAERARSPEFVQAQFEATVRPMYHQFVGPSRQHAETVVQGNFDPAITAQQLGELLRQQLTDSSATKEPKRKV